LVLGQARQRRRQFESDIITPQPHRANQGLAVARRLLPRCRDLGRKLQMERLLARLIEFVQGAGPSEFRCELCGRFGCRVRLLQERRQLARRNGAIPGPTRFHADLERFPGGIKLSLTEAVGGDLRPSRERRQRKHIADKPTLNVQFDRG
jgi:hypothetical protein